MKNLVILFLLFSTTISFAQYGSRDSNKLGISGGITQLNLISDQFNAKPESGWMGGLSLRGNYYNDWQTVFGMNFTDSNFSLQSVTNKDISYKLSAAQLYFLFSYMLIENHVNLEIGPVLQVNGKLKIDKNDELLLLKDSPLLTANDIVDVTKINGNVYVGISAGSKNFRLSVSYQYGLNNFMNNINKDDILQAVNGEKFKANLGLISGMIVVYL